MDDVNYLDVLAGWTPNKQLCPVPLFTLDMQNLLDKASLLATFEHYPLEKLTAREVAAIRVIRAEMDRILEENQPNDGDRKD